MPPGFVHAEKSVELKAAAKEIIVMDSKERCP